MLTDRDSRSREDVFRRLFEANFRHLLGYALRRALTPEDAADVAAETMLVAWRRLADVPAGEQARLWLYGVARGVLSNHRRSEQRRDRLGIRLRQQVHALAADPAELASTTQTVRVALERLSPDDRELILLSAWEELEPREVAVVLGVSADTVRTRLHRARGRLLGLLGDDARPTGHVHGYEPSLVPEEQR